MTYKRSRRSGKFFKTYEIVIVVQVAVILYLATLLYRISGQLGAL